MRPNGPAMYGIHRRAFRKRKPPWDICQPTTSSLDWILPCPGISTVLSPGRAAHDSMACRSLPTRVATRQDEPIVGDCKTQITGLGSTTSSRPAQKTTGLSERSHPGIAARGQFACCSRRGEENGVYGKMDPQRGVASAARGCARAGTDGFSSPDE